ncbi:MAG: hypothetical protein NTW86_25795 [Candidatus Sumerlaeota bacterium]|nr:hypothetical protein [Candidatus Sumerlaeota bacterium]
MIVRRRCVTLLILTITLAAALAWPLEGKKAKARTTAAAAAAKSPRNPDETSLVVQQGEAVDLALFGVNDDWSGGVADLDNRFLTAGMRALGVSAVRFVGAAAGSLWDWQEARFVETEALKEFPPQWLDFYAGMRKAVAEAPGGGFTLDRFVGFVSRIEAQPVWVFNLATPPSERAERMADYLATKKFPAPFLELGSDYNQPQFRSIFASSEDYIQRAQSLFARLRSFLPEAKIGVVADGDPLFEPQTAQAKDGWNDGLLAHRDRYDAWAVHCRGIRPETLRAFPRDEWTKVVLAWPDAAIDNAAEKSRRDYDALPLWLSDYSIGYAAKPGAPQGGDAAEAFAQGLADSPLNALRVAAYLIAGAQNNDVWDVMLYHNLTGTAGQGMLRPTDNGFQVNPAGQVFAHLAMLARQAKRMHNVRTDGGPGLDLALLGEEGRHALQAAAFSNDDMLALAILNRAAKPIPIVLAKTEGFENAKRTVYSAEVAPKETWAALTVQQTETFPWPGPMQPDTQDLALSEGAPLRTEIPGYSLVILELR